MWNVTTKCAALLDNHGIPFSTIDLDEVFGDPVIGAAKELYLGYAPLKTRSPDGIFSFVGLKDDK